MANITRKDQGQQALQRQRRAWWDPFEVMRQLTGWDPYEEAGYGGMTRGGEYGGYSGGGFTPRFDVKETEKEYVFKADLPGVKDKDLDIQLVGNRLTVSGRREHEEREEGENYYAYERSFGTFSRSFTLPEGVDPDHIDAELKEGVLTLCVPKRPETQPKRISLKGAAEGVVGKVKGALGMEKKDEKAKA